LILSFDKGLAGSRQKCVDCRFVNRSLFVLTLTLDSPKITRNALCNQINACVLAHPCSADTETRSRAKCDEIPLHRQDMSSKMLASIVQTALPCLVLKTI
jgi:hypothetical protein